MPTAPGARSRCTARSTWACCARPSSLTPTAGSPGSSPRSSPKNTTRWSSRLSRNFEPGRSPGWDSPSLPAVSAGESHPGLPTRTDLCSGAKGDTGEEARGGREPADHGGEFEAAGEVEALVGEEAASEAETDREDRVGAEVPVGEDQADSNRDHRLEDHRPGDVAEGQRVLAFAHPEEAVDLLRQLGRQRRQDQRQDQGLDADAVGDLEQLFDEEVGAADHRPEPDQELDHAEREGRVFAALAAALEDQRVQRLLALNLAPAPQRQPAVAHGGDGG